MKKVSIIIADDHQLFAEGIRSMFDLHPEITVVDKASNFHTLNRLILTWNPTILLLDIKMPDMDGITILKMLREKNKSLKIIILSSYSDYVTVQKCKIEGANGFINKTDSLEELEKSIKVVAEGGTVFPKEFSAKNEEENKYEFFSNKYNLSKREWDIIQLIKHSYTNKQISQHLNLSIYTVETHRKNIIFKLGIKNSGSLVRFIYENGI